MRKQFLNVVFEIRSEKDDERGYMNRVSNIKLENLCE